MFNLKNTEIMKKARISLIAAVVSLIAFTSCDKQTGNSNEAGITIKMTDAPGDYAALNVEIERVEIYSESSGWVELSNESQIVNVLELTNGVETTLATSTQLEAGLYTQVAVYFGSENSIQVQSNGEYASLEVGGEGMIVSDIHAEVSASAATEVLLDFNVAESVELVNGEFVLNPVVETIADAETGIHGQVEAEGLAHVTLTGAGGSFSAYTDASGFFLIRGMAEGSYTLEIEAQGESSGEAGGSLEGNLSLGLGIPGLVEGSAEAEGSTTISASYENVAIVQGEITQMGSISLQ
jgi:hypothetical protein